MLDERKREILKAIIQDYIFTAEPVGSRALVKRHDIGLSPATIRNEMADLEEMGYLEQPHTSAGRIPSHWGYRFYVNTMMGESELSGKDSDALDKLLVSIRMSSGNVSREVAKLLSSVTSYLSLIAEPASPGQTIRHIDIIPVTDTAATLIVVLSDGTVRHHAVNLPQGLESRQVRHLTRFVNKHLEGITLQDIDEKLVSDLKRDFAGNVRLIDSIFTIVHYMMLTGDQNLVIDGATNLLNQPEFKDVEKVRKLLHSLEQNDQLLPLLQADEDIAIKIGAEIGVDSFSDCSLIIASYTRPDRKLLFGILGPARMEYAKTVGLLKRLRQHFQEDGGIGNE